MWGNKVIKKGYCLISSVKLLLSVFVLGLYVGLSWLSVYAQKSPSDSAQVAEGESGSNEKKARTVADILKQEYRYNRDNRSDPFRSFIKKKEVIKATINKLTVEKPKEKEEILTGLQLFEPGQLNLVSIILFGDIGVAMVQDSAGKGYMIEEGTLIGRAGIVESISRNIVVIKQWGLTFSGQKRYKNIELILRKEGE